MTDQEKLEEIESERYAAIPVMEDESDWEREARVPIDPSREWELDGETHRTRKDAYRQVMKARMSSLVAASPEYLENLVIFAREWIEEIQEELNKS